MLGIGHIVHTNLIAHIVLIVLLIVAGTAAIAATVVIRAIVVMKAEARILPIQVMLILTQVIVIMEAI